MYAIANGYLLYHVTFYFIISAHDIFRQFHHTHAQLYILILSLFYQGAGDVQTYFAR